MNPKKLLIPCLVVFGCASTPAKKEMTGETKVATKEVESKPAEKGNLVETSEPGAPGMAFNVMFYTGSVDDPPGKEGLTALTAQLIANGGTAKRSYAELLEALYPLATSISTYVDKEQTTFSGFVHPDHARQYASLLAEVITTPALPLADFERIRTNLVNDIEKRLRATDDENLGKAMLDAMIYPQGHPYHHPVGGTVKGLKSISLADVQVHAKKVFSKSRLVIGVGGAVDPAAKNVLVSALSALPEGAPRLAEIPEVPMPKRTQVMIAQKPGKAVAISMGYPHSAKRGHPDFSALGLVQSYFGEHRQFHGVLMAQMRGLRGLNYGDYAYVEKFIQEGWGRIARTNVSRRRQHFEIWIRPVDPKDAVFSIRLARHFTNKLVDEGISQKDVAGIRTFLTGYTRLWELTPARRLGHALDDHFYGTHRRLDAFRKDLEGLDAASVNASMRRHIKKGPMHIAIVAPDAVALRQALIHGAPSKKTYEAKVPDFVLEEDKKLAALPLEVKADDIVVVNVSDLFER